MINGISLLKIILISGSVGGVYKNRKGMMMVGAYPRRQCATHEDKVSGLGQR